MKHKRALVLSGGGARGAYQAGVLKYISEIHPQENFDILVGSSSGAINIAGLASYQGNLKLAGSALAELWSSLTIRQVFRVDAPSILRSGFSLLFDAIFGGVSGRPISRSLVDTTPLHRLLESSVRQKSINAAIQSGKIESLAITATEVSSRLAVTFIQSNRDVDWLRGRRVGRPVSEITVDHIMASAALPFLFPSVLIDNKRYVDGCLRLFSPLSPATKLGATKIMAIGVRQSFRQGSEYFPTKPEPRTNAAEIASLILNSIFFDSLESDAAHLHRINALLKTCSPSVGSENASLSLPARDFRDIDILLHLPSMDLGLISNRYRTELPFLVRYLLRGLGSESASASNDFLSYLLFSPYYLRELVGLGYRDAKANGEAIAAFFQD